jgi:hypothetical protein
MRQQEVRFQPDEAMKGNVQGEGNLTSLYAGWGRPAGGVADEGDAAATTIPPSPLAAGPSSLPLFFPQRRVSVAPYWVSGAARVM